MFAPDILTPVEPFRCGRFGIERTRDRKSKERRQAVDPVLAISEARWIALDRAPLPGNELVLKDVFQVHTASTRNAPRPC